MPLTVAARLLAFPAYFVTNQEAVAPIDAVVWNYNVIDDVLNFGTLNKPEPGSPFPYGFDVEPR